MLLMPIQGGSSGRLHWELRQTPFSIVHRQFSTAVSILVYRGKPIAVRYRGRWLNWRLQQEHYNMCSIPCLMAVKGAVYGLHQQSTFRQVCSMFPLARGGNAPRQKRW